MDTIHEQVRTRCAHFAAPVAVLVAALLFDPVPIGAQEVLNTSYTTPDGGRVLQQQIVVPATLDEVWKAFTTSEGLSSFAAPLARADFRLGGIWEASFDPDAEIGDPDNIRNEYIAFVPMRMIAIQTVNAPPDFPHPELLDELFFVLEMEDLGANRVRLTESGVGFGDGEGWDTIWELFERGNEWTLQQLYKRFAEGPIDWSAVEPTGGDS